MIELPDTPRETKTELTLRHIREQGAKYALFLAEHPDIDPNFADDLPAEREAEWGAYSADLAITQQIERDEHVIDL